MSVRITKTMIDAASPRPKGDAYLWDSAVPGFGLKVTTRGSKSFIYQYRIGGRKGRNRRYTIGRYGAPWTVELARNEARRLAMLKAQGIDPLCIGVGFELARVDSIHPAPHDWPLDAMVTEAGIFLTP